MSFRKPLFTLALFALGVAVALDAGVESAVAQEQGKKAKAAKAARAAKAAEKERQAEKPVPSSPTALIEVKADPSRLHPANVAKQIDAVIEKTLAVAKVPASPRCTDEEFLRRAYLDITGTIPTADKARAFLDSTDPQKRAKLIDELLNDPNYGRRMADLWSNLLVERMSDNRRLSFTPLHDGLKDAFNKNVPWNKFVYDFITAVGEQENATGTTFFLAAQTVDKMTDQTSRVFLGVQLQCAQCHDHPFTDWKQTEYWAMANFFSKVQVKGVKGKEGNPSVMEAAQRKGKLPESAKVVPAKFLQGEQPRMDERDAYRPHLARWMTSPGNPFFAKAFINRTWSIFFGRGFVMPVDDMHKDNPASHPELLKYLSDEFVRSGFDVKHIVRSICLSNAYQRSSIAVPGNEKDRDLFSHQTVRVLQPEQLFDSLTMIVVPTAEAKGRMKEAAVAKKGDANSLRERFVAFFTVTDDPNQLSYESGIPQALRLMNSRLTESGNVVKSFAKAGTPPAKVIEQIYLSVLSRRPSGDEMNKLLAYVTKAGDAATAYSDIVWALLNSSEFSLNR